MSSNYWRPAILVLAVAAFIGGAVGVERYTIDRLLHDDAVSTAHSWTAFIARNIPDLTEIAVGDPATKSTLEFVANVKAVGRVFLFKIYDASGEPRFISNELPEGATDDEDLADHNPEAQEAIEAGQPAIEVKRGTPPSRPEYYSEAYIPTFGKDGKVNAVVEAYIDQTEKQAGFERASLISATAIGLLVLLAFGIPAGAWYWRKREQERAEARIHFLANYDALSGLANRARFTDGLTRALAEATVAGGLPIAVHCVDIDRFKDINDTFGLTAGDMILKIAADRLTSVAGSGNIVARLGGDELAVIQRGAHDAGAADTFAREIARTMAAPVRLNGQEIALSVGVGIAMAPDHGNDAERLIKSAELALAKGKSEGRGRIRIFSRDLDSELVKRLRLERAIDTALANNGFLLHFQPLYSEPGEVLTGFEALARLPNASGGFIPPIEFIPAAERMGAIGRLGAWVMTEACRTAANWPDALTVSVNLSAAQFAKESVADMVGAALATSHLEPSRLLLEITESLLLTDSEAIMAELGRLKALGAKIVMDDFGTGYSSLSYLWRFPFDKIKIDGSFMRGFDAKDSPAEKIVRTIATLGHTLNMRVCIEGVESERHAGYARLVGCDEVQGYHFGRPAAAVDVAAIILADFRKRTAAPADDRAKANTRTG